MAPDAEAATRIREGHPEGYLLAFANLYQLFAQAIMARELGRPHERHDRALLDASEVNVPHPRCSTEVQR